MDDLHNEPYQESLYDHPWALRRTRFGHSSRDPALWKKVMPNILASTITSRYSEGMHMLSVYFR